MPEIEGAQNFADVSPASDQQSEQPTDTASAPEFGTQDGDTAATSGQEATAGQTDAEQDDLTTLPDDAPDWARARVSQIAEQRRAAREEAQQYRAQLDDLAPFKSLVEDLRAQGYTSDEAVREAFSRQEQETQWEAQQAEQTASAQAEINKWQDDGLIDPSLSPVLLGLVSQLQQLQPMAQRIQEQEQQQQYQRQVETAVTTLKGQYADMDEQTVRLAIAAGADPTKEAQRTHQARQQTIAAYNAQTAKTRHSPAPEGGNGQAPGLDAGLDPLDPSYRAKWEQQIAAAEERRARYGASA